MIMIVIMHDNCAADCWYFDCYCYSNSFDYQEYDNILTFVDCSYHDYDYYDYYDNFYQMLV